jgi:putative transposase
MAVTLEAVPSTKTVEKQRENSEAEAARELVRMTKEQGLALTGPDGLLKQLTKTVIGAALDEVLTEHLGYERHDTAAKDTANSRNGVRAKTVLTETTGPVEIDVPRDREGTFEPKIVAKRQRRLTGVDEMVLSLYAKGLTTGEISAHFAEIYGASVSKETVSRITDRVLDEMAAWQNRPLDEGRRSSSTPLSSRSGSGRSPTVVSTPPSGSPEVVENVWPLTTVQTCIISI